MIARLVDWSLAHRASVLMIALLLALAGAWSLRDLPLDALPTLGETQVIVQADWQADPQLMEQQVTAPLVTGLMGIPGVRALRASSEQATAFVHVIFDDRVEVETARARVAQTLATLLPRLPQTAEVSLGPSASGLGWVYQYVLEDKTGQHSPADLRDLQDWYLRYALTAVPGVAEVAALGGAVREYQVDADPIRLQQHGISIGELASAVRGASLDVGGQLIEFGGAEYGIRGRGAASSRKDFAEAVVAMRGAAVIRVQDVATVIEGAAARRGWVDLDGKGDRVTGIVVMQAGANARQVAKAVGQRLQSLRAGLPSGVEVVTVYDRAVLINRALETIGRILLEVTLTVALVVLLFLRHLPSALVPVLTLPLALLIAFLPFRAAGLSADIMSLGGLAIAIGVLADAGIVMVEQVQRALGRTAASATREDHRRVMRSAIQEVATPGFLALLVIAVSFLPVLALEGEEGRLFAPLALAKSLAVAAGALLGVTLDPVLRDLLLRFRHAPVDPLRVMHGPMARLGDRYARVVRATLARPVRVLMLTILALLSTIPVWHRLERELMPPLEEGSLLYMPVTQPGLSAVEARRLLAITDSVIAEFPEVARVLGKAGRADTATDPAPPSMLETLIELKPVSQWRHVPRWYSAWVPDVLHPVLRPLWPDRIDREQLVVELDAALRVPGLTNAWTMPIKGRLEMLDSGLRSPLGLKVSGPDAALTERLAVQAAEALQSLPGTRSAFAERNGLGRYLDIRWRRDDLARAGIRLTDAQETLATAIGGEMTGTVVHESRRHGVRVRLARDYRDDPAAIRELLIAGPDGVSLWPLATLADVEFAEAPAMIRNENGMPTSYVTLDLGAVDPVAYLDAAKARLAEQVSVPTGYTLHWAGALAESSSHENLFFAGALALGTVVLLLLLGTGSAARTALILLAVPFSAVGAVWLVWLLGFKLSTAVYIGFLALLGVDAATGVFMLLYLDLAWREAAANGALATREMRCEAVVSGAARRLRPKLMTVTAMLAGLIPILFSTGTGADVMQRMAAPMIGGIVTSFLLELLVYPSLYLWYRQRLA